MKGFGIIISLAVLSAALQVGAQYEYPNSAPPPAPMGPILPDPQLDQLLGPVALYPDPLIAQILPAATQPSQIAVAANYLASGGDPNLIDQQPWDTSVRGVAHYPDVLQMLNGNLDWTSQLGQAFLNQPTDVMNSIQRLRAEAQNVGNLQNTPQEEVVSDDGQIEILPADPNLIYVPQYDPGLIFFRPHIGFSWGLGFHIGPWLDHDFDWHDRHLIDWDRDHPRPGNWWHERPVERRDFVQRAPVWHAPARNVQPGRSFSPVGRGDRGYAPRPAPPREVRPAAPPRESRPTAPREVRPEAPRPEVQREVRPAPEAPRAAPAPSFRAPAPSRPSAFGSVQSTPRETRAASSRGSASRAVAAPSGGGNRKH